MLICGSLFAQTPPPTPTDNASFFASAQSYFTSFNPEFSGTFTNNAGSAWTGIASVQGAGVPLQNEIGISYRLVKPLLQAEVVLRDSGVTGGIVSVQGGIALVKIVNDVKLTGFIDGGLNIARETHGDRAFGEVGVRIQKAMTTHTFTGISAAVRFPSGTRVFQVFTGFVF